MEPRYLTVLADCCKSVFQEMTHTQVFKVGIKRDERFKEFYSIAQVSLFEDFQKKMTGNFFLGFTDERMAVQVASTIAENYGLPRLRSLDEDVKDLLNEFMNTILGHTITVWDKMGFRVRFSPPVSVMDVNVRDPSFPGQEAFMIILDLGGEQVVLTVTSTDSSKQDFRPRVLVVDDSGTIRGLLAKNLIEAGFAVDVAEDGLAALDKYQAFRPHLTIMDLNMPNMGGLDAIQEILQMNKQARFIILTSTARRDEEMIARSLNVLAYVIKPVKMHEFLFLVKEALG